MSEPGSIARAPHPFGILREQVEVSVAAGQQGVSWLLSAQAPDGSWGYRPGGSGYVEPTALAILALLQEQARVSETLAAVRRAAEWLRGLQRADGSWGISAADDSPSWMTAYALWALLRAESALGDGSLRQTIDGALRWLLADASPAASPKDLGDMRWTLKIDGSLVGWPWVPGDAHWIFPTAISMVAAGLAGRADATRVRQGVAFLHDRACEGGGWNVGNPYMFDKAFAPTVADTAVALLALKAAGEGSSPGATAGLARLRELLREARSPLGLAWGALAIRAYGASSEDARGQLVDLQSPDGSWQASPFATALAVLALGDEPAV